MATPKKKFSKKKTAIRKKIWTKKAEKKALVAFNWANLILKKLNN